MCRLCQHLDQLHSQIRSDPWITFTLNTSWPHILKSCSLIELKCITSKKIIVASGFVQYLRVTSTLVGCYRGMRYFTINVLQFMTYYFSCYYTLLLLLFQICYCSVFSKAPREILQEVFPVLLFCFNAEKMFSTSLLHFYICCNLLSCICCKIQELQRVLNILPTSRYFVMTSGP